jgi:hypothetical protein
VGNTWADTELSNKKTMKDQVLAYRKLAYRLSLYFDRIVYATIGKGIPLDMWGNNYDPRVRIHHENILHAIRDFVPKQIFVDEHWRDMKNPNRECNFTASYDQGYLFGYALEHDYPIENARRLNAFVQEIDAFFF